MEDYRVQNSTVDLNSLVESNDLAIQTMNTKQYNYLKPQQEPNSNFLPEFEKKMPITDPNVNFGKAMLCSVCFLGMYIALYTA